MTVRKRNRKNRIVVPKEARQAMGVKAGDELLSVVKDDITLVIPTPKRYARTLQGLAKGTYPSGYLNENAAHGSGRPTVEPEGTLAIQWVPLSGPSSTRPVR